MSQNHSVNDHGSGCKELNKAVLGISWNPVKKLIEKINKKSSSVNKTIKSLYDDHDSHNWLHK